ncbi:HYC_CC_PP family protein [Aquimarina agarivorans]|uniref:HYC_CC_PP family protein n=1 Tax=Aquimarina agarivorans TaxID=980584 RepID=UPI000495D065
MNNLIYKITSIFMTFVVLLSTMSFTISSHFCGDTVMDVSYFSKASSCGMEIKQDLNNKDCSISKKNCCKDVTKVIEGQDDLKKSAFDNLSFDQQVFVASFCYSYINLFKGLHNKVIPFKNYSPPLVVKDIQALDEVYLI